MGFIDNLLDGSLMPHGQCLLWRTDLLFLHMGGDSLTVLAYGLIPLALIYLVFKRSDLAFNWIFVMFAAFIFLCGITHLVAMVNIWYGYYYLAGVLKFATGLVSVATAVMCWRLIPTAIAIPSNAEFREKNEALLAAQAELIQSNRLLEERVQARTLELERLARTDALTKLLNRGGLTERLEQEVERCIRYKNPMSILMIDLDHFKSINDNHGHPAGDSVLVEVADILRSVCRVTDAIGRHGGEEFLVVLPETNIAKARELAERIRLTVKDHHYCADLSLDVRLTCSIGVSDFDNTQALSDLLQVTDEMLYRAKREGRDKVVVANLS